jgi:hypothetical protein
MLVLVLTNIILLVAVIVLLMRPEPEIPERRPRCPECGRPEGSMSRLIMHMQAAHPHERYDSPPRPRPYR